jgi:endonuclease/exonuclease/phosphatase family metal-dependent hydrolase
LCLEKNHFQAFFNKNKYMKKTTSLLLLVLCSINISLFSQTITLSGTQYTEAFDGIGTGLPNGWSVKTAATATTIGTDATLTTAATLWNGTSGRFNNYASADIGETGDQNAATDRALGVRQTGTVGDPGAAFVIKLANTTNLSAFNLSFKLQSLDKASTRTVIWGVDYAIGDSTVFTPATTNPAAISTGGSTYSNQQISVNFGSALDNKGSNVWIRVRTIATSTGAGNRPSTGIDDFALTYTNGSGSNTPTISASPVSLTFANTEGVPSEVKSYNLQGSSLTGDITATAPANFEISLSNTTGFANSLTFAQTGGNVTTKTVYVRLSATAKGTYSGNIAHTSAGATVQNVAVSGTISAPLTIISVASAKTKSDSTPVAISGRLLVTNQFGGRLIYVQDNTAGMAVFGSSTTFFPNTWKIGDSVQIAGIVVTFNGFKEIVNISQATLVAGQTNKPVAPIVITAAQQLEYEGSLVTIKEANFVQSGNFTNNTNFDFANCANNYAVLRIVGGTANDIVGKEIPKNTRDLTGVMTRFNATPQLQPRFLSEIATVAATQCTLKGVCPTTALVADGTFDRTKTFDLATWNVEWLGNTGFGPSNEQLQQDNVKCVVEKLKSDVIVLVEVCDTSKMKNIVPAGYDYRCSAQYYSHFYDTPETAADPAQKVCVAFNRATVTPIEAECKAILTTNATFTAASPDNNFWASGRLPYMFTANVTLDGITRKVRIVGIHAKAGAAIADYNRRLTDVQALKKELDDKYPKEIVIVAGDFNDDLDSSITAGQASSYANFMRDSLNYKGITKVLSDAKKRSTVSNADIVDHIVISNELFGAYLNNTADVATASSIGFINAYGSSTTDHFPVWARFDLKLATSVKEVIRFGALDASISPNPTNGDLTINIMSETAEAVEINAYDAFGRLVKTAKNDVSQGANALTVNVQGINSGIYHIYIKQADKAKTIKVVKF